MAAEVYFIAPKQISSRTLEKVFARTRFLEQFTLKDRLALKVHFGEKNNYNHLAPEYVKMIIEIIKKSQLKVSVVETSSLYRGARQNRTAHLKLAIEHGFSEEYLNAPIEILDGERGEEYFEVPTPFTSVKKAKLARGLQNFSGIVNLAHFKGHFVVGFGGALKNIAMGLAAKGGKLEMHSETKLSIKEVKCQKCKKCLEVCPAQAILITETSSLITNKCVGCACCVEVCPIGAIKINWDSASETTQVRMAEYVWAILQNRRAIHFNFAIKITPNCDCMDFTEDPMMPDIGLFASLDPVACDNAVWEQVHIAIRNLYPQLNPEIILEYSEKIGLGTRKYKLIEIKDEE
ncbi:MAG: DUF362 domain-containing protein [candidate division WOR-3 bacterium]|nr:DUF362 domain-containing protein [candidate division WOR-3 bacterium]MCX7757489.1 DUF362 domain-containing protein [candidate division WOR-3 bacterium]MDW7987132.1 DUF362 domain-containing protein [candidate division WOR-3 bacterium]